MIVLACMLIANFGKIIRIKIMHFRACSPACTPYLRSCSCLIGIFQENTYELKSANTMHFRECICAKRHLFQLIKASKSCRDLPANRNLLNSHMATDAQDRIDGFKNSRGGSRLPAELRWQSNGSPSRHPASMPSYCLSNLRETLTSQLIVCKADLPRDFGFPFRIAISLLGYWI